MLGQPATGIVSEHHFLFSAFSVLCLVGPDPVFA